MRTQCSIVLYNYWHNPKTSKTLKSKVVDLLKSDKNTLETDCVSVCKILNICKFFSGKEQV